MDHLWETLCQCLDEELERQQTVMAVCQAHQASLRSRQLEQFLAKTHALELLIHEATLAEKNRLVAVSRLVAYLELPVERQTLSELVRMAPPGTSGRLAELQRGLQELLPQIRALIQTTQERLHHGCAITDRTIRILVADDSNCRVSYPSRKQAEPSPVLIDSRG